MSSIVDRAQPRRSLDDPAPENGEFAQPVDGAWRVWEKLRRWDQRYAIVVDTTLAIGLFLACSGWLDHSKGSAPGLEFVAALTLPLILRRRAPIAVFMVVAAVALIQWVVTGPLLADTALLVALYTVTAESDWLAVVVAGLILEIGVIAATVRWTPVGNYFKSLIFLSGMAAAALLAGIVVRALRSQMGWLVERAHRLEIERDQHAFLAAAAERARIAREMHDVVSHNIQVMVTLADAAAVAQRTNPQRAVETMHEVSGTGRQALNDMRRLLGLLRDGSGSIVGHRHDHDENGGLAPQPGLGELDTLAEKVRSTGLAVTVDSSGTPFALSEAAGLTVYRIAQEALTNTMKHAESARSVKVSLSFNEPEVTVQVSDDGKIPPTGAPPGTGTARETRGSGHGVVGMSERAAAFGGSFFAGPNTDGGWLVAATLHECRAPGHS